jgi:putative hydrolase of the HAD superfamily
MPKNFLVFDLDDTLVHTGVVYERAKDRFAAFVCAQIPGLDAALIRNRFEAVDLANATRVGFGRARYPNSMVETFHLLCAENGRSAQGREEREAYRIGDSVFEPDSYVVIDGAIETLEAYRRAGHRLGLCTKGDEEVQGAKIDRYNLREIFTVVDIVPKKTADELGRIAERLRDSSRDRGWMIGDSRRDDIASGNEAGFGTVWVADPARIVWGYESGYEAVTPTHTVQTIAQLPGILPIGRAAKTSPARSAR